MELDTARFAVIDTETTGLDVGGTDELVEIAAVAVGADESHGVFQTLVNPGRPIPATASAIHHLIDYDVRSAPPPDEAVNYLTLSFSGFTFVAHNAAFDKTALDLKSRPWLCTQRLAKHLWPEAPSHSNQVLRYWLALHMHLPRDLYPHRALYDAICTASLLRRELRTIQLEYPDITTVSDLIAFSEQPAQAQGRLARDSG